ncbi:MAG TPA: isoprenylcysteine carboxylmethyltransferase family protein [Vicinamibacteria bacterium]
MGVLVRAMVYVSLFASLLFYFVPARILAEAGVVAPRTIGLPQVLGLGLTFAGASLALWCIFTFVFAGKGTPAPFDPPRRLVVRGPYRLVRNPMYAGAVLAVGGASLYFRSAALAAYAAAFLGFAAIFVRLYEEPALERTFGEEYRRYRRDVGRWIPRFRG